MSGQARSVPHASDVPPSFSFCVRFRNNFDKIIYLLR